MLSSHAFSESCSLSRPPVLPAHNLDGLGLQDLGHWPDARLCTSLIKVASSHGQGATALGMYEWMRARREEGGAALHGTVHTYTVAMRAALAANMLPQALKVKPSHPTSSPPPPPLIQRIIQASSEDRLFREAKHIDGHAVTTPAAGVSPWFCGQHPAPGPQGIVKAVWLCQPRPHL